MATFLYQPSTHAQSQLAPFRVLDKAVLKPAVAELGYCMVEQAPATTPSEPFPGVTFRSAVSSPSGMTTYDLQRPTPAW